MKKWVELAYEIGQEVYLKTDKEQSKRIVVSIWLLQSGVRYQLLSGINESWHYDFEINTTIDIISKVQNND